MTERIEWTRRIVRTVTLGEVERLASSVAPCYSHEMTTRSRCWDKGTWCRRSRPCLEVHSEDFVPVLRW